jgi:hypothetical protein
MNLSAKLRDLAMAAFFGMLCLLVGCSIGDLQAIRFAVQDIRDEGDLHSIAASQAEIAINTRQPIRAVLDVPTDAQAVLNAALKSDNREHR